MLPERLGIICGRQLPDAGDILAVELRYEVAEPRPRGRCLEVGPTKEDGIELRGCLDICHLDVDPAANARWVSPRRVHQGLLRSPLPYGRGLTGSWRWLAHCSLGGFSARSSSSI